MEFVVNKNYYFNYFRLIKILHNAINTTTLTTTKTKTKFQLNIYNILKIQYPKFHLFNNVLLTCSSLYFFVISDFYCLKNTIPMKR